MTTKATANETLASIYDDHNWTPAVFDTNTTQGIQLTLKAQSAAIQALADHIDGVNKDEPAKPAPRVSPSPAGTQSAI